MPARTNLTSTRRAVGALRRAGRPDDTDAGLVKLAETLAAALDDAVAAGEKGYAVAGVARVHLAVLAHLDASQSPAAPEDPFAELMRELATPGAGPFDSARLD